MSLTYESINDINRPNAIMRVKLVCTNIISSDYEFSRVSRFGIFAGQIPTLR